MLDIAANIFDVRERIAAAAARAGRAPSEVRLLPVSKTKPPAAVLEAHAVGERRFGENKVQEALSKWEALGDVADLEWVIVGHLQSNKAKYVARFAAEFQALDSLKVAAELDRRLHEQGRQLDVLIQVNSSGEPQKFGLAPEDVSRFAAELRAFDALRVRGLMTLALFTADQGRVAQCFATMNRVRDRLRDETGEPWPELSMGMSGDFELAIEHGATCVRVGQAIFGDRLNPNDYWPGVGV